MSSTSLLPYPPKTLRPVSPRRSETFRFDPVSCSTRPRNGGVFRAPKARICVTTTAFMGGGLGLLGLVGPALAGTEIGVPLLGSSVVFNEPSNALSLPTWAVHVSSVAEWITAMALVWQYGDRTGNEEWKGLSWGMVLVALQAALTVLGNVTMCVAAFRIYRSQSSSENS